MKKIKVVLDFPEKSVPEKIVFFRNVLAGIKLHAAVFAKPDLDLDKATASVDTLETNYIASLDGGRAATAALHASEVVADDDFRILAAYVGRVANGDEGIILSSGFNTSKQPAAIQKAELTVTNGPKSGTAKLRSKAIPKAGSYIWQMAKGSLPTSESGWINIGYSTQAEFEVDGLDVATIYYFRRAAVTPDGTTDFCAPVMKVIE